MLKYEFRGKKSSLINSQHVMSKETAVLDVETVYQGSNHGAVNSQSSEVRVQNQSNKTLYDSSLTFTCHQSITPISLMTHFTHSKKKQMCV